MKKNIGAKFALYPTPATVVGTVTEEGKVNWLLVAHVGIVSHSKLLLSMHSSHFSNTIVKKTGKLSVNLIDENFIAAADYTGIVSGAKVDKSKVFDYHLGENGTPVIEASPLCMECEVVDTYEVDGFENFICSIKNTYIETDKLDEGEKIDYTKLKPVLFEMPTYKYLRTGDVIGDCVKIGKAYGAELNQE
jgi:flavin reductase (DIM6/NTAB) family NADH-FMN oxidoreductase RutF